MSRIFVLFYFAIISCSSKKGPTISYDNKIINLGNLEFKKSYHGRILIKNTGDEILKILDISADCSCTVPDKNNMQIAPGQTVNIKFVLTPAQDGFIQQSIFVNNNSINENRVLFLIRAKVNLSDK